MRDRVIREDIRYVMYHPQLGILDLASQMGTMQITMQIISSTI